MYEGNEYEDVGAFQLYGMAQDVIVHAERGVRTLFFVKRGHADFVCLAACHAVTGLATAGGQVHKANEATHSRV